MKRAAIAALLWAGGCGYAAAQPAVPATLDRKSVV